MNRRLQCDWQRRSMLFPLPTPACVVGRGCRHRVPVSCTATRQHDASAQTAVHLRPSTSGAVAYKNAPVETPSSTGRSSIVPPTTAADELQGAAMAASAAVEGARPSFIWPYTHTHPPGRPASELPLLLYLPGIDGTGMAASRQFPELVEAFELQAFSVPIADRRPFDELVDIIMQHLEEVVQEAPPERPIYLLGESFGALLALAVAARAPRLVDRLILINPATSYSRSVWPQVAPLLTQMPDELYCALPYALSPVLGNPIALAAKAVNREASLPEQGRQLVESLTRLLPQLGKLANILPAETLAWKLQLLRDGNAVVQPRLRQVRHRTLLLTGRQDLLLPSREEGPRLQKQLPRCRLKELPTASHALLQEAGVSLMGMLREEGFYVERKTMTSRLRKRGAPGFGTAAPIEMPTRQEAAKYSEGLLDTLRQLTSPVFFSTLEDGRIQRGFDGIPPDRPLLLVGNHQTFALDTGIFMDGLIQQAGLLPRGLAHPAVFQGTISPQSDARGEQEQGLSTLMSTFGAVPVTGKNFFQLMRQGEMVLLYPGGVREAYKNKGEAYRLFWPSRSEFVRMAARFDATIVPFGGVGSEDGVRILLDRQEIRGIPFLGPRLEQQVRGIPAARQGVSKADEAMDETFIQPLAVPQLPSRLYFKFGAPIRTRRSDLEDRGACDHIYQQTKASCEECISWLLHNRKRDPYRDFLPRAIYERSWDGQQAPTFPLDT